ncbi:hypothetical protein [Poseidonibacter ostreae]|jgi:hypothetical protein|uniref:Uncharacterized protein n=1 Tax=Poseidonibacter ostreae TaxID=2654171 RepID=A0A6L4WW76_9BACT|nr:hypothetical protein [Poseidonibacter ostreae]KAB7885599.1 hypothetical protein GA417_07990 [Poseidonibacter ostreae]KAB7891002.1 hypothetical protein GBG19_01155 [Poseidonibacter ostreae]KAB7892726.1 hypothetical protein GBG18_00865 [Poseidonibacter ostreae]MAC83678.1 hypothetical protein [Arcobacter sp.]|tara:strand:+ start:1369 stop:1857 length:489 start_codon:yes stop_codon:yes gene_type:complete
MKTDILTKSKNVLYKFDKITSNNGKDRILALIWIFILEFTSTVLEYEYLDTSEQYIFHMEDGLTKEIFIASLFVLFIWYSVYSIVFMYRKQFITLALYGSVCIYLLITHDITFNLLIHNLNPGNLFENGFGFYLLIQLFLKLIITYLVIKMLISIKKQKQKE